MQAKLKSFDCYNTIPCKATIAIPGVGDAVVEGELPEQIKQAIADHFLSVWNDRMVKAKFESRYGDKAEDRA